MSENENNPNYKRGLIIGCSVLTFLGVLGCLAIFATIYRSEIPVVKNYFPTSTPTRTPIPTSTPIPHILVHTPPTNALVLKDDFTTNQNDWSTYYSEAKVEVKNEKLTFESFDSGSIGIAYCFCGSPVDAPLSDNYYLQADLSTEKLTREPYGLVFGLIKSELFYEFSINPVRKKYYLQRSTESDWLDLTSGLSKMIRPYPEANTLSVYFDHGTIELFINGEKVATYVDKNPINKGKFGFIVDDYNFKLLVDNLFAYNK